MEVTKNLNSTELTVALNGRLDTNSSPEVEKEIFDSIEGVESLIVDLEKTPYTSSAGLRVFLKLQKQMDKVGGSFKIINANADIIEIFDITGFADIITIA